MLDIRVLSVPIWALVIAQQAFVNVVMGSKEKPVKENHVQATVLAMVNANL